MHEDIHTECYKPATTDRYQRMPRAEKDLNRFSQHPYSYTSWLPLVYVCHRARPYSFTYDIILRMDSFVQIIGLTNSHEIPGYLSGHEIDEGYSTFYYNICKSYR